MKTTLICLAIAICARLAFELKAQTFTPPWPKEILIYHTEYGTWAKVVRSDTKDWQPCRGWHPSYTSIITSYEPIVHKRADAQWEIVFTSQIARDIP